MTSLKEQHFIWTSIHCDTRPEDTENHKEMNWEPKEKSWSSIQDYQANILQGDNSVAPTRSSEDSLWNNLEQQVFYQDNQFDCDYQWFYPGPNRIQEPWMEPDSTNIPTYCCSDYSGTNEMNNPGGDSASSQTSALDYLIESSSDTSQAAYHIPLKEKTTRANITVEGSDGCHQATEPVKAKVRVMFTTRQVNALNRKFNSKKYLKKEEAETLGKKIGLTYKQVKTWFQNHRMKGRREQRNIQWKEEYKKKASLESSFPPHVQPTFQPQYDLHYTQQMTLFLGNPPQNPAFYQASESSSFPQWPQYKAGGGIPENQRSHMFGWSKPYSF